MSDSYVYFIRPIGMDGPIKIGCSGSPEARLLTLSTWSPFPLEIVAKVEGGLFLERNIHECFSDLHSHREWFRAEPRLLEAIEALRAGKGIADAIDLTARVGKLRDPRRGKRHSPSQKRRLSFMHRRRWAVKKLSLAAGADMRAPVEFDNIMSRWEGCWSGHQRLAPSDPTAAEVAYLEAVLADPAKHFVPFRTRWPHLKPTPLPKTRGSNAGVAA